MASAGASGGDGGAAGDSVHIEGLKEVFRCFICMERLRDARLCPHCSKFGCYQCIRRWITEQRAQCPHCRCPLRLADLVKCRWADEVTQRLDTLKMNSQHAPLSSDNECCSVHNEKLSVFCWTCQDSICHHCALWGGQHSGHTLKPLEDEYSRRVGQISDQMDCLRRSLRSLIATLQQLERNMETIRSAKEDRVREIRCAVELMIARLDSHMKAKLITLTGQKRSVSMEVEMVEGMLCEVEHQLGTSSHPSLVRKSAEIFRMLKQMQKSPPHLPQHLPVQAHFESEIVPQYNSQELVLRPFSELRAKAEPVYSLPLHVYGMSWRLKVYPDGNGVVRGNYMSVFLELSQGSSEQARYEYRVEMIHQDEQEREGEGDTAAGNTRNIVREFASDFEVGECWGYNRFFKVEFLAADGYLNTEQDSVKLKFHVRAPTFYQKCTDLQWYINRLETALTEQRNIVQSLSRRPITTTTTGDDLETGPIVKEVTSENANRVSPRPTISTLLSTMSPERVAVQEEEEEEEEGQQEQCEDSSGREMEPGSATERDVDDENRSILSMDNDVEEELAAVGGLAQQLNRISLALPDRESTIDLVESVTSQAPFRRSSYLPVLKQRWPRPQLSEPHADDAERTVNRIQEAFRSSLPESDTENQDQHLLELSDWTPTAAEVMTDEESVPTACPPYSPRTRKQLFRKLRSRHRDQTVASTETANTAALVRGSDLCGPSTSSTVQQMGGGDATENSAESSNILNFAFLENNTLQQQSLTTTTTNNSAIDIGQLEREIRAETALARARHSSADNNH